MPTHRMLKRQLSVCSPFVYGLQQDVRKFRSEGHRVSIVPKGAEWMCFEPRLCTCGQIAAVSNSLNLEPLACRAACLLWPLAGVSISGCASVALSCSFEPRLCFLWPTSAVNVSGVWHPLVLFSFFWCHRSFGSRPAKRFKIVVFMEENIPFVKPTPRC